RQTGRLLALRVDITSQVARLVASTMRQAPLPLRLAYAATVFRYHEPRAGRQREFEQIGVELIGLDLPEADAEMIAMAVEGCQAAGLPAFQIDVGQVEVVRGLVNALQPPAELRRRLISAIRRKDALELDLLLAEVSADTGLLDAIRALPKLYGRREVLDQAERLALPPASRAALANLAEVVTILENYGLADQVILDLAETHDFEYYSGVVFGAFARGLGYQLASGGRYDHLIGQFGYPCPATGFCFDLERVLAALTAAETLPQASGPDVLLIDFSPDKQAAHRLARLLRDLGFAVGRDIIKRDLAGSLAYARASADWAWRHYDESLAAWRKSFDPGNVFGYRAPGGLLEMASIYASLYEREKNPEYAARARKVLLAYGDYRSEFPEGARKLRFDYEDGVPALPDFFTAMRYIRAYEVLHRLNRLTPAESSLCEALIAGSIGYMLRTQEWGAMNRSALRAENLAWAVRALPVHPQAKVWDMQRKALGDDNWGHWEIEDATIYHGVWLYALLGYAEARRRVDELFRTPTIYYYAQYFLNLLSPAGMIPDFGDAHWEANWTHYLVFFEAAAAQYKNPALKWAAALLARKHVDFNAPTNVGLGYMFMDIVNWGSDAVPVAPPDGLSREVMDDVQGKKIVFRNGWEPSSTYLLWNYRDEGDGGLNFRDYLRDTIPIEEEKVTHGHADENSIPLLMAGRSVLLHDAGYRDYMPSGPYGQFRQDYFHNRLCVRPEKIFMGQKEGEFRYSVRNEVAGQGVLDFLHDS
ncbi:MAG: ATP phosphoribosyltransferase regulatory subunit, partial [Candidatus Aminicenantales bacterium]